MYIDNFDSLLQDGIEPMWEDERNKRGGRWLITLNKQQRRLDLDRYWLETVGFLLSSVVTQISNIFNPFSGLLSEKCIYYLLAAIINSPYLISAFITRSKMSDYILQYLLKVI